MNLRLRFWLAAMETARVLGLPHAVYLWLVRRASDATDWGEGAQPTGEGEPF